MKIDISLKNMNEFINKFNSSELNAELGEYIFNKARIYKITRRKGLRLNITIDFEVNEQQKNTMIDIIRGYYGNLIKLELIYLKTSYIKSAILFLIGIVLLVLSQVTEIVTSFLLPEIFVIMGWLAIWEMAYNVLFYDSKHRINIKLLKKLTKCYIEINS